MTVVPAGAGLGAFKSSCTNSFQGAPFCPEAIAADPPLAATLVPPADSDAATPAPPDVLVDMEDSEVLVDSVEESEELEAEEAPNSPALLPDEMCTEFEFREAATPVREPPNFFDQGPGACVVLGSNSNSSDFREEPATAWLVLL